MTIRGRTVQWCGDNEKEVEQLIQEHLVRSYKDGDILKVSGIGLDILLNIGDSLILDGDRLGVLRAPPEQVESSVTWKGDNVQQFVDFLVDFKVGIGVIGQDLYLHGEAESRFILNRGDRLVNRHGQMVISKVGTDHRLDA